MTLKPILAAIVTVAASIALPMATSPPAEAQECPAYWVIGARGSGQSLSGPFNMGSTVGAYVQHAADVLPSPPETAYLSLPYDAAPVGPDYFRSVDGGWQGLQAIIRTRIAQCPQIRIGLVGYSQGAHVVNQALFYLGRVDPGALEYVRSVLLIADPRSDATARYHLPITVSGDPAPDPQHGGILTDQTLPTALHERTTSVCISGDPVCDAPDKGFELLAQAVTAPFHDGYRNCCTSHFFVQILGRVLANRLLQQPPNRPPRITADAPDVTAGEGQDAVNSGTVTDPDGNPVTIAASVGTVTLSGNRWTWRYTVPSEGQQTVAITARDSEGATSTVSFTLNGTDVAPKVTIDAAQVRDINEGDELAARADFTDAAPTRRSRAGSPGVPEPRRRGRSP